MSKNIQTSQPLLLAMNVLNALVVDPDSSAIEHLRELLDKGSYEIKILGAANTFEAAKSLCLEFQPPLFFLDPQVPDGFELLRYLGASTRLICITDVEKFALRAFEVGALDYLLKPLTRERLSLAISRLAIAPILTRPDFRLTIKGKSGLHVFSPSRISHILSSDHSTQVFLAEGEVIDCNRSMQDRSHMLAGFGFQRLDRTLLVNPAHIHHLDRTSRNEATLSFCNGVKCIKIGRIAMQRLRKLAIFTPPLGKIPQST